MFADNQATGHNRHIRISEIPGDMEMVVDIKITHTGGVREAVLIDGKIIPEILKGLQLADIFADYSVADVELMMEQMKKFTPSDEIFGDDDDADADEFTLK